MTSMSLHEWRTYFQLKSSFEETTFKEMPCFYEDQAEVQVKNKYCYPLPLKEAFLDTPFQFKHGNYLISEHKGPTAFSAEELVVRCLRKGKEYLFSCKVIHEENQGEMKFESVGFSRTPSEDSHHLEQEIQELLLDFIHAYSPRRLELVTRTYANKQKEEGNV